VSYDYYYSSLLGITNQSKSAPEFDLLFSGKY